MSEWLEIVAKLANGNNHTHNYLIWNLHYIHPIGIESDSSGQAIYIYRV